MTNIIENLQTLISFKTVSIDSAQRTPLEIDTSKVELHKAFSYLRNTFEEAAKVQGKKLFINQYNFDGRPVLVVSTHNTLTPDIALLGHMDVVPALPEKFTAFNSQEDHDKLYGRGAIDDKFVAAIAPEILAFCPQGENDISVSAIITSDEEVGGAYGTGKVRDQLHIEPKLIIMPDGGSNGVISNGANGLWHFEVNAVGRSGHNSRPQEGDNAIEKLHEFHQHLRRLYPYGKRSDEGTVVNPGTISGGELPNKIPDTAQERYDARFSTSQEDLALQEVVAAILPRGTTVKTLYHKNPHIVDMSHEDIQLYMKLYLQDTGNPMIIQPDSGSTDAVYYPSTPAIITLPNGGGGHKDDEWISISSLYEFKDRLMRFIVEKNACHHVRRGV